MQTLKTQRLRAFSIPDRENEFVPPSYSEMLELLADVKALVVEDVDAFKRTVDGLIISVRSIENISGILSVKQQKLCYQAGIAITLEKLAPTLKEVHHDLSTRKSKKLSNDTQKKLKSVAFYAKRL